MTLKVKLIQENTGSELETSVNAFIADKDPANVLDIQWVTTKNGANVEQACFITYQEA